MFNENRHPLATRPKKGKVLEFYMREMRGFRSILRDVFETLLIFIDYRLFNRLVREHLDGLINAVEPLKEVGGMYSPTQLTYLVFMIADRRK